MVFLTIFIKEIHQNTKMSYIINYFQLCKLHLYLYSLSVIFHTLACLHRLIARTTIGIHQYDVESAMLEHSLIAALAWSDVQGSVCFIPYKLDFREFTLLIVVVVTLVLIECNRTVCKRSDTYHG